MCTDGILKNVPQESIGTRSLLRSFFDPSKRSGQQLEILELGSGCGIVGVGLARTISNARIILTDLPEAMDILQKNISKSINVGLASGTTIRGQTLDWNTVLTNTQNMKFDETQDLASLKPDLVLVSDCTYNPSSFEALIATLVQLVKQAHQRHHHDGHMKLDVLVSYKTRHESESRFFEDMDRAGFEMLAEDEVLFPNRTRETLGLDLEKGEIFAFGLRE